MYHDAENTTNVVFVLNGRQDFACWCSPGAAKDIVLSEGWAYTLRTDGVEYMRKLAWHQFGEIRSIDQLNQYINGRETKHTNYFHYSGLAGIDSILRSKSIWVSSFNSFNDKAEAKRLKRPELCFGLCFSTGINENLPMWYMYSGLNGRGGRLRLTKNGMVRLLKNATYELSERDSEGKPVGKPTPLEVNRTIDLKFADVLYCGDGNKSNMDLKYNTMTNHVFPLSQKEELNHRFEGFVKSLIWYYEKETRLLIRLIGEAERLVLPGKEYMIILHFDESVYKMLSVTCGPEIEDIEKGLIEYPNIKSFIVNTSKVSKSAYAGDIEMKLCRKCKYSNEHNDG